MSDFEKSLINNKNSNGVSIEKNIKGLSEPALLKDESLNENMSEDLKNNQKLSRSNMQVVNNNKTSKSIQSILELDLNNNEKLTSTAKNISNIKSTELSISNSKESSKLISLEEAIKINKTDEADSIIDPKLLFKNEIKEIESESSLYKSKLENDETDIPSKMIQTKSKESLNENSDTPSIAKTDSIKVLSNKTMEINPKNKSVDLKQEDIKEYSEPLVNEANGMNVNKLLSNISISDKKDRDSNQILQEETKKESLDEIIERSELKIHQMVKKTESMETFEIELTKELKDNESKLSILEDEGDTASLLLNSTKSMEMLHKELFQTETNETSVIIPDRIASKTYLIKGSNLKSSNDINVIEEF